MFIQISRWISGVIHFGNVSIPAYWNPLIACARIEALKLYSSNNRRFQYVGGINPDFIYSTKGTFWQYYHACYNLVFIIYCLLYLQVKSLPGLPDYILIYLFYFTASTCAWQAYLILIDTMGLLIEKFLKRKAVNPQSKWVEIDGEYKNYTFFKCHRLSLLFRIRKPSAPSED